MDFSPDFAINLENYSLSHSCFIFRNESVIFHLLDFKTFLAQVL